MMAVNILSALLAATALVEAAPTSGRRDVAGSDTAPWYRDSSASIAEALGRRDVAGSDTAPWYRDSAASIAEALGKRDVDESETAPCYRDSAASIAEGLAARDVDGSETAPWYRDSAASIAEGLAARDVDGSETAPWYRDSAASIAEGLAARDVDGFETAPWYRDSAASIAEGLAARDVVSDDSFVTKESTKMEQLKAEVFSNVRRDSLRESSERGKLFFQFTPVPRNDTVDRWHVPDAIKRRYELADDDSDRVSVLNNYLYVTGRQPLPAATLGFEPTMMMPGLPERGNEVGYGYALSGQHQYHCANFLADAIEIGKDFTTDFYLFHTVHCLAMIKHLSARLTEPEPVTQLTRQAQALILSGFPQRKTSATTDTCSGN